jgi:hypothetical protein
MLPNGKAELLGGFAEPTPFEIHSAKNESSLDFGFMILDRALISMRMVMKEFRRLPTP